NDCPYQFGKESAQILRNASASYLFVTSVVAAIVCNWIFLLGLLAAAWIGFAALLGADARVDVAFTRAIRGWHFVRATWLLALNLVIYALPIYCVAATWNFITVQKKIAGIDDWGSVIAGSIFAIAMIVLVGKDTWLEWRVSWYEYCR